MVNKDNVGPVMAVVGLISLVFVVFYLLAVDVPKDNKDLINIGLMAIVSAVSTAFGYYLGGADSKSNVSGDGQ